MGISYFSSRQLLSLELGHRLVNQKQEDMYIVSFPRSGNTWMRTMLAYLLNPASADDPDLRNRMIPGVSLRHVALINRLSSPRYIKSHTWYRQEITRAVYLVRDGRDVIISLYHYYITRQGKDQEFQSFLVDYLKGRFGQLWHTNVESWLVKGREVMGNNLLVVKFEDMKENTADILGDCADFLGITADSNQIEQAVDAATLPRMRKVEQQRKGKFSNSEAAFYRGGKTGEWKEYFVSGLIEDFFALNEYALRLAGYISNEE